MVNSCNLFFFLFQRKIRLVWEQISPVRKQDGQSRIERGFPWSSYPNDWQVLGNGMWCVVCLFISLKCCQILVIVMANIWNCVSGSTSCSWSINTTTKSFNIFCNGSNWAGCHNERHMQRFIHPMESGHGWATWCKWWILLVSLSFLQIDMIYWVSCKYVAYWSRSTTGWMSGWCPGGGCDKCSRLVSCNLL